jgi:hypothetical protein
MVKVHSHLKLIPASILDKCKVFEHIDILFWGRRQQPQTVIPTLLVSDFGVLGHLWSQNDVITSWLRLKANSNCFLYPHHTYAKCLSTLICCPWEYGCSLKQLYPPYLAHTLWFWVCRKPPSYVPYKGTYVPYDGTFGMPDQGQMLDV